jgi:hypothetical protein
VCEADAPHTRPSSTDGYPYHFLAAVWARRVCAPYACSPGSQVPMEKAEEWSWGPPWDAYQKANGRSPQRGRGLSA